MTDKEKFMALMEEFGVPLVAAGREATETLTIEADSKFITLSVTGYSGFVTTFTFEAHTGKFLHVGIWE